MKVIKPNGYKEFFLFVVVQSVSFSSGGEPETLQMIQKGVKYFENPSLLVL